MRLCAYRARAIRVLAKPINPPEFTLKVRNLACLSTLPLRGRFQADFSPLVVPSSSRAANASNRALSVRIVAVADAFGSLLRVERHFDGEEVFAALRAAAH